MTPFNINDYVRVKLTDLGRSVLAADDVLFWARHGGRPSGIGAYKPPKEDSEGWSKWQLWSLMQAFGSHLNLCCDPVFETTIELYLPATKYAQ